jgi:K+-transporting ATPase c subunit
MKTTLQSIPTEPLQFGFLGELRVNILQLNRLH